MSAYGIVRGLYRIVGKVGIARRSRWLRVTEHLADDSQAKNAPQKC